MRLYLVHSSKRIKTYLKLFLAAHSLLVIPNYLIVQIKF